MGSTSSVGQNSASDLDIWVCHHSWLDNEERLVLYLYIETLKQRLDAINQLRVDRALAAMGPAFQHVYSLLPTLLHYHHPLMPGYLEGNVPHGVCFFTPQQAWRKKSGLLCGRC
ncbi:hypothetical protein CRX72_01550 [Pantoea sp. BRM17]|nr:hypothetical protein CRX72_01550 [Pantoea sp. BRM17]